jgi:LysM repeat protein
MKTIWIKLLLLALLLLPITIVKAQNDQPDGPVYIVQPGDNLWSISRRFGVSIEALTAQNGIANPNQLTVGMQLVIPGLEGIQGVLTTQEIPFGESLTSLSRRYEIPMDIVVQLNKYTSPASVAAGSVLIIPEPEDGPSSTIPVGNRTTLKTQQSLLELAISQPLDIDV